MYRTTLSLTAALSLALAGCSATSEAPTAESTGGASSGTSSAAAPITVTDAWTKAVPELGDMPMTGVFGTITNTTGAPITITGASTPASAVTELHETVSKDGQNMMQKVDGGFVVDAGATRELRPGGDHIMLMRLAKPVKPGEVVTITLTTSDGGTVPFEAVAKTYTGGDEKYHTGSPMPGMSGSSMSTTPGAPGASGTTAATPASSASESVSAS